MPDSPWRIVLRKAGVGDAIVGTETSAASSHLIALLPWVNRQSSRGAKLMSTSEMRLGNSDQATVSTRRTRAPSSASRQLPWRGPATQRSTSWRRPIRSRTAGSITSQSASCVADPLK